MRMFWVKVLLSSASNFDSPTFKRFSYKLMLRNRNSNYETFGRNYHFITSFYILDDSVPYFFRHTRLGFIRLCALMKYS